LIDMYIREPTILDGTSICNKCGTRYSVTFNECPICNPVENDHILIRVKNNRLTQRLYAELSRRDGIDSIRVLKNMKPDHRGFSEQLCEHCYHAWVSPEERICIPCERSYK
jgi:hypothetical protein